MADVLLTWGELADAVGGRLFGAGSAAGFSSVAIDSRSSGSGSLFVALKGERADGHDFLGQAFASGARGALVSLSRLETEGAALRELASKHGAVLVGVPDTLRGLQDAAAAYLRRFPRLVRVGITGSSGKTTTKELAASVVGAERRTVMNKGNLNSDSGLPLSAFEVREEHEVGIFELGMNRVGEISEIASVLRPSIALVTNVGTAHIGILGSRRAIAEEKKAIFRYFDGGQIALVPESDDFASFLAEGVRGEVRKWGSSSLSSFGGARSLGLDGTEIVWGGIPVAMSLPGRHNLSNALAAAAIAEAVGVSGEAVRKGLAGAKALFGRGEILRGRVSIVRDCYNANPESLEAAVGFCDEVAWSGRKLYVIGSMLELGTESESAHADAGRLLAASNADRVYFFGPETEAAARAYAEERKDKKAVRSDDMEELSRILASEVRDGDLVLLKGSRGTALERLVGALPTEGAR